MFKEIKYLLKNMYKCIGMLKWTLNFGITKIWSNELRFGWFKSQNAHLGVLYLPIMFNRNHIFVGLPKLSVNLLPLNWTACICGSRRFCHVTATSPYWFSDVFLSWQVSILVLHGSLIVTMRSSKYLRIKLPNYRIRLDWR
jgi:hypothetical protein